MKNIEYNQVLSNELFDYYITNNIGHSPECKECKSVTLEKGYSISNGPIPFFHIGSDFSNSNIRLLFLGMVAYGWEGELGNIFFSATPEIRKEHKDVVLQIIEERVCDLYFHQQRYKKEKYMVFFSYMRRAAEICFGEEAYKKIAISNMLKCNSGAIRNHYPQITFDYCIRKEKTGNLIHDMKILKPTHVVMLTSNGARYYRYKRLIEQLGINVMMIGHPSSSISGTKESWANKVKEFVIDD